MVFTFQAMSVCNFCCFVLEVDTCFFLTSFSTWGLSRSGYCVQSDWRWTADTCAFGSSVGICVGFEFSQWISPVPFIVYPLFSKVCWSKMPKRHIYIFFFFSRHNHAVYEFLCSQERWPYDSSQYSDRYYVGGTSILKRRPVSGISSFFWVNQNSSQEYA